MTTLSPATLEALRAWLLNPWYARHGKDMERFYRFVESLARDIRTLDGEEGRLLDLMRETLRAAGEDADSEQTIERLKNFRRDVWMLLDFVESCSTRSRLLPRP